MLKLRIPRNHLNITGTLKSNMGFVLVRALSNNINTNVTNESESNAIHFRASNRAHPLFPEGYVTSKERLGDHTGKQQNHIWSETEIHEKMSTLYTHKPATWGDRAVKSLVRTIPLES